MLKLSLFKGEQKHTVCYYFDDYGLHKSVSIHSCNAFHNQVHSRCLNSSQWLHVFLHASRYGSERVLWMWFNTHTHTHSLLHLKSLSSSNRPASLLLISLRDN